MNSITEFKNKKCNKCIHNTDVNFKDCSIVTNIKGNKQCIYFSEKDKKNEIQYK